MGIYEAPTPMHWNYFLALEDDLVRLSRYLEPTTSNFDAYSLELARILLAASSEVDVVAKRLCQKIEAGSKAQSINRYRAVISGHFQQLAMTKVEIPRFGLSLQPWSPWANDKTPEWWNAYNNVKHQRHIHFAAASLKHTLNAVAGLFVLLLFFYQEESQEGRLRPDPEIFRVGMPFHVDRLMWGSPGNVYNLLNPGTGPEPVAHGAGAPPA